MGVPGGFGFDRSPSFEPSWLVVAREKWEKDRLVEDQVVVDQDDDVQEETPGGARSPVVSPGEGWGS